MASSTTTTTRREKHIEQTVSEYDYTHVVARQGQLMREEDHEAVSRSKTEETIEAI